MNVLGLDIAMGSSGWAVLTLDDGDLVDCGLIRPPKQASTRDRLIVIQSEVRAIWDGFTPVETAIEEGVSHRNGTTTRMLAAAWAAALLGSRVDPQVVNITAAKRLATGSGAANKAQMTAAAVMRWGSPVAQADMADAAWVAEAARLIFLERMDHYTAWRQGKETR